jgi:2,3-dihydroxyphenylpropionate 1,2-dioxygenase
MSVHLVCASHSPLMQCYARPPAAHDAVVATFRGRAEAIRAFDPQIVFVLAPDHYNGFFLNCAAPFCVGLAAEATADIGGTPGRLEVPRDVALACARWLREADVDVAVSDPMIVDHGFSQPMARLLGGLDRYPAVPIFVNALMPPYAPFKRARLLGKALGEFARALGRRVLLIGSGGMSHHPQRYYPPPGTAEEAVARWQQAGPAGGGLTREEWLERLERMHYEGAAMLVSGERTRADIRLNPELDRRLLDCLCSGDLAAVDRWDPQSMADQGGIGWLELNTWIAACAANETAGGAHPSVDLYEETLEYGIATGVIHAG